MTGPPKFVESKPYEKGFAEIFEREIVPKLEDAEQNRLELLRQIKHRTIIAVIAVAGIVAAAAYLAFLGLPMPWLSSRRSGRVISDGSGQYPRERSTRASFVASLSDRRAGSLATSNIHASLGNASITSVSANSA